MSWKWQTEMPHPQLPQDRRRNGSATGRKAVVNVRLNARRKIHGWSWPLFLACAMLDLAMAYLVPLQFGLFEPEGMWHSVQSWLVLSGQVFRLSLFSTPEPPLPTILQLPLAIWPDFQVDGLAGSVVSAFSTALACTVLSSAMAMHGLGWRWRAPLLAMFALNPLILYYSGSSSSASIWMFLVLLSAHIFLSWMHNGDLRSVITLGFVLGIALLVKYDAAIYSLAMLASLCVVEASRSGKSAERILGLFFTSAIPIIFVFGIWLLFSLLVSFGPYSLTPKEPPETLAATSRLIDQAGLTFKLRTDMIGIDGASWSFLGPFPFFAIGLIALAFDGVRTRNRTSMALLAIAATFPVIWLVKAAAGLSSTGVQDTILTIPLGFFIAVQLLVRSDSIPRKKELLRSCFKGFIILAIGISTLSTGSAVIEWAGGASRSKAVVTDTAIYASKRMWETERTIAAFLRGIDGERRVLIDDDAGYRIIFLTGRPELFVTWGMAEYPVALHSPVDTVDYVLVRNPQAGDKPDSISGYYPALYELGAPWAELAIITEANPRNQYWHLYKVIKPSDY